MNETAVKIVSWIAYNGVLPLLGMVAAGIARWGKSARISWIVLLRDTGLFFYSVTLLGGLLGQLAASNKASDIERSALVGLVVTWLVVGLIFHMASILLPSGERAARVIRGSILFALLTLGGSVLIRSRLDML